MNDFILLIREDIQLRNALTGGNFQVEIEAFVAWVEEMYN